MKVVVIGCGRVGSGVSLRLDAAGHDVAVIDQALEAFDRLGPDFGGATYEGHALDLGLLAHAGTPDADACVVATSGDNTNLVVAQVVERKWHVPKVVVRVLDPHRAGFYAESGLNVVSPTQATIQLLVAAATESEEA